MSGLKPWLRNPSVAFGIVGVASLVVAACGGGSATATPTTVPAAATRAATPAVTTAASTATPAAAAAPTPAPTRPAATPSPSPTAAPTPVPTPAGQQPKYGGILRARLHRDWDTWDTYHPGGGFTTVFNQQLLSNLVRFRKDSISKIESDVAETWELGADGKTYTFRLRKDVTWSDGKPLTAADVAYNFQRAADPKYTFNKERVAAVATVETPDPNTVRVTLKRPSASFLPNIAGPFMLMYPSQVPDLAQWQKSPVGSGPFVFKEYNKSTSYIFRKNTQYYGKDAAGRSLPYLDGVDYNVIPDPALALAAFRSGRLQCGCGFDNDFLTENKEQLEREIPGVKLELAYAGRQSLKFNLQRAPFNNLAFRQALAIGLDKEKAAAIWRGGKNYRPAPPLIPPELGGQWGLSRAELEVIPGYNPDHSKDLAIALQKLKESGIDPKTVRAEVMFGTFFGPLGELVATLLSDLGINATVTLIESPAEMTKRQIDGNFAIAQQSDGLGLDDPGDQYTSHLLKDGSANFGKYGNDRVDQLLRDQDGELDPIKRRAVLVEVERIQLAEFPFVPYLYHGNVYGTRPDVFNYRAPRLAAHAAFRLEEVWIQ